MSKKAWSQCKAKVPDIERRTQCTLYSLKQGCTKIGLEYKQVSSFSDHMQRMTVEEFGERLKERWKALTRNLK